MTTQDTCPRAVVLTPNRLDQNASTGEDSLLSDLRSAIHLRHSPKCERRSRRVRDSVASSRRLSSLQLYSQMKLQMKREALEKINRQANEMPLNTALSSRLRNATPSVFHQRHIGRVLRSSCNTRGRRLASSRDREPRPSRCPPLWPGDLRNVGGSVPAASAGGGEA